VCAADSENERRTDGAPRARNQDGPSLASLIERSAELKRALVDVALSPRMKRHLQPLMAEAAGPGAVLAEDEAIRVIDRFALQHRLPDGTTVLDQVLADRPDLTAADREILRGWRDPVEGYFEILRKDRDSVVLLNLLDDLEYRTYSNMGPAAFRALPRDGFVHIRLVPIRPVPGAWLVSGSMRAYAKSDAARVARAALDLAAKHPELVYRNPEKVRQGWEQMRADRAAFVEFFGGDELVLPPAEAEARLNAYYRHRQEAALARQPAGRRPRDLPGVDAPAFELPPELADADTIGIIYDETDGLNFYNDYGRLHELFADPALAADKRYADVLRGYLRAETVGPLPLRRLAAAHPDTADAVFRKVLRKPDFTWAEHGEALLRQRKPWYYEQEPRPGVSVIGTRLSELLRGPVMDRDGDEQARKAATELDELKIPKAMLPVAEQIIQITDEVCADLLDAEYAGLARQAVAKLARKRPSPLLGGRRATWAAAVVYALGQVNFLFDPSTEPCRTADELSAAFGVAKTTMSSKAKQVRDLLKMSYFKPEFLRADVVAQNPMVWLIEVNGLAVDSRSLPVDYQVAAFRRGYIPYVPALGRDGTAALMRGEARHDPAPDT
jgi:hypothetical protein